MQYFIGFTVQIFCTFIKYIPKILIIVDIINCTVPEFQFLSIPGKNIEIQLIFVHLSYILQLTY